MKTIVFIDLLSGGHREAFMRFFVKSCLELNCKVVCIYPDTRLIKVWVEKNLPQYINHIIFIDFIPETKHYTSFWRFNHALKAFASWKEATRIIKKTKRENNLHIDLVFFNCLDNMVGNFLPATLIDLLFPYKWSGLYLHPLVFRMNPQYLNKEVTFRDIDSVFQSKKCIAITLHDEGLSTAYKRRIKKEVIVLPENADNTPPAENNKIAEEIRARANGRIILGIIGMEPYKGSYEFLKLAKAADPSKYFFAFLGLWGGEEWKQHFEAGQVDELLEFEKNLPENCYWNTVRLSEGAEYNSVFNVFDIVWLVYKRFYSSSNRLTKAALFDKPVLSSNIGCVGEDVPKYNLGEAADENSTEDQLKKLEILRDKILRKDLPHEQWKRYAQKHSLQSLKEKFQELFNLVP